MKRLLMLLALLFAAPAFGQGCPHIAGHAAICAQVTGIAYNNQSAHVGFAYSNTSFSAIGANTGTLTWAITSGSATQNGLTLNVGSSASETGTATAAGASVWTLQWTDSKGLVGSSQVSAIYTPYIMPHPLDTGN